MSNRIESGANQCSLDPHASPDGAYQSTLPSAQTDPGRGTQASRGAAPTISAAPEVGGMCVEQDQCSLPPDDAPGTFGAGAQSLVAGASKPKLNAAALQALSVGPAKILGASKPDESATVRQQAREEVLRGINALRVPQGPLSQATEQLWQATADAETTAEQVVGAFATAGMVVPALAEETARSVLNVPANAAEFGARVVGMFDGDTAVERNEHATGAVSSGLRTAQGLFVASSLSGGGESLCQLGNNGPVQVISSSLEQAGTTLTQTEATGDELLREVGAAAVGGAMTAVASNACGNACGGVVGQLTQDVISGSQLDMQTVAAAGTFNASTGVIRQGVGSQAISSAKTYASQLETR